MAQGKRETVHEVHFGVGVLCDVCRRSFRGRGFDRPGGLRRGEADMSLSKPSLLLAGGLVFYDGFAARLNDHGAFGWISLLRARAELSIPRQDSESFLGELLRLGQQPRLELPEELQFDEVAPVPKPKLRISS